MTKFTLPPEILDLIRVMRESGHSFDQIAEHTGYDYGTVWRYARQMGLDTSRHLNAGPIPGHKIAAGFVSRAEQARRAGLTWSTLDKRLRMGWDLADAVTRPVQRHRRH